MRAVSRIMSERFGLEGSVKSWGREEARIGGVGVVVSETGCGAGEGRGGIGAMVEVGSGVAIGA